MNKTIVTWAIAALLAVPAVPIFAKTVTPKKVTHHSKVHKSLVTKTPKHRTLHHHKTKHVALTSVHAGRHLSSHLSTSIKHKAKPAASASHPKVKMMHQPTIDGMHT